MSVENRSRAVSEMIGHKAGLGLPGSGTQTVPKIHPKVTSEEAGSKR